MTVTPVDVAVALGVAAPEPPTHDQWAMWITDAEMLIEIRRVQLNADHPDQMKLDYVVREAVVAQVKRPDDSTQVTVSVDDGSTSRSYRSGKGRVTILDDWWGILGLTDPKGAFSLDMIGTAAFHLPWCSLNFGSLYCSCGASIAGTPIYEGGEEW